MAHNLYDLLGIDQLGAERVLARRGRAARPRSPSTARTAIAAATALQLAPPTADEIRADLTSAFPGVPPQGLLGWPLGFSTVLFALNTVTTAAATALPQRPIKANRLVVDVARTGTTATGLLTVDQIQVGTTPQQCSNQPLPSSMYSNVATDIVTDFMQAEPGIECRITYTLAAPALLTTDTVNVASAFQNITAG